MEKNEFVCNEEELEKAAGGEGEEEGPMYLEGIVAIPYKQWGTKEEVGVRLENGEVILCELYPSMKKGEIPQGTRGIKDDTEGLTVRFTERTISPDFLSVSVSK